MKYKVVQSQLLDNVVGHVNWLIEEGWRPIGGIAVAAVPLQREWAQAMVLYEKDDIIA